MAIATFGVFALATGLAFALPFEGKLVRKVGPRLSASIAAALALAFPLATLDDMTRIASWTVHSVPPSPFRLGVLPVQLGVHVVVTKVLEVGVVDG